MTIFILLAVMLTGGLIFISLPVYKKRSDRQPSLTIKKNLTKELRAIILFVSNFRQNETLEDLLAYKVLAQLDSSSSSRNPKHVWLLHSGISSGDGSSYLSASHIAKKFKSEKIKISSYVIDDVFDANTVFPVVRRILASEDSGVPANEIVCDCTAGTKLITLGMALASFGRARIIYFSSGGANDASEYIEIDSRVFLESLYAERQSL